MSESNSAAHGDGIGMTAQEKRHDQLTSAPDATEADAEARIDVTESDGVTRIDIAEGAPIRPGPGPGMEEADALPPE